MGARDIDIHAALANWARWCKRDADCYPSGHTTNWQLIEQMEYKSCHVAADEKLVAILEHKEPNEIEAMRVERAVQALNRPLSAAIRVHYVTMPDDGRHALGLDLDQWNERRARHATRRSGWYFSPAMYLDAVDKAIDEIEARL